MTDLDRGELARPVPIERNIRLRREIRAAVVYYLKEELRGGELYKEVWESCEDAAERGVVEGELGVLIHLILGER